MNKNPDVDAWLTAYDNPMKGVVIAVREVILKADARMSETVKWQAPTFVYKGNLASFFPKSKAHASLMFHKGVLFEDRFPSLEGGGKEARTMKFLDLADLGAKEEELAAIAVAWCNMRDSG